MFGSPSSSSWSALLGWFLELMLSLTYFNLKIRSIAWSLAGLFAHGNKFKKTLLMYTE